MEHIDAPKYQPHPKYGVLATDNLLSTSSFHSSDDEEEEEEFVASLPPSLFVPARKLQQTNAFLRHHIDMTSVVPPPPDSCDRAISDITTVGDPMVLHGDNYNMMLRKSIPQQRHHHQNNDSHQLHYHQCYNCAAKQTQQNQEYLQQQGQLEHQHHRKIKQHQEQQKQQQEANKRLSESFTLVQKVDTLLDAAFGEESLPSQANNGKQKGKLSSTNKSENVANEKGNAKRATLVFPLFPVCQDEDGHQPQHSYYNKDEVADNTALAPEQISQSLSVIDKVETKMNAAFEGTHHQHYNGKQQKKVGKDSVSAADNTNIISPAKGKRSTISKIFSNTKQFIFTPRIST